MTNFKWSRQLQSISKQRQTGYNQDQYNIKQRQSKPNMTMNAAFTCIQILPPFLPIWNQYPTLTNNSPARISHKTDRPNFKHSYQGKSLSWQNTAEIKRGETETVCQHKNLKIALKCRRLTKTSNSHSIHGNGPAEQQCKTNIMHGPNICFQLHGGRVNGTAGSVTSWIKRPFSHHAHSKHSFYKVMRLWISVRNFDYLSRNSVVLPALVLWSWQTQIYIYTPINTYMVKFEHSTWQVFVLLWPRYPTDLLFKRKKKRKKVPPHFSSDRNFCLLLAHKSSVPAIKQYKSICPTINQLQTDKTTSFDSIYYFQQSLTLLKQCCSLKDLILRMIKTSELDTVKGL